MFEGLPVNSNRAMLANPKYYKYYCNPLRPSWGEPYRDVASRMSAALSSALREARGREALVVSHQNPIVTLTRFVNGQPLAHSPKSRHCALASITSFIFSGATLVGTSYAEPAADLVALAKDMTPGDSAGRTCAAACSCGRRASLSSPRRPASVRSVPSSSPRSRVLRRSSSRRLR